MANRKCSMSHGPSKRFIVVLALAVLGLYVAALLCPAFIDHGWGDEPRPAPGWGALLFGWFLGQTVWAWFGNLFLVAGLWCLPIKRYGSAALSGYVAAALAMTAWFAGFPLLIGYYFWLASFMVLAVGAHLAHKVCVHKRREENAHVPQNRLDVPPPLLNGLQESSRVP